MHPCPIEPKCIHYATDYGCSTYGRYHAPVIIDLKAPDPRPVEINPADSALVIVDMQNEYLKAGGKRLLERGARALRNLAPLLGRARDAGSQVIHVQSVRAPDCLEHTLFGV